MGSSNDHAIVERDPSGRYVRFNKIIGSGGWKIVYSGFDEFKGVEIAWSKEQLVGEISFTQLRVRALCAEAHLLGSLNHENILKCYKSWVDKENKTINMITEYFTSGNLIEYIKKYNHVVNRKAIQNWCRQILEGLNYLHNRSYPIIHRDIKCENIFINGNSGIVKLGDFGLAMILNKETRTVCGTSVYVAPEILGLEYNELVDIHSFGMSVLQMATRETPYRECGNDNERIFKKITTEERPAILRQVTDPEVLRFILKCLTPASDRPSASELLNDLFLREPVEVVKKAVGDYKVFDLRGSTNDNVMRVTLKIFDLKDHKSKRVGFDYMLQTDTVRSVMEEMAIQVEMPNEDFVAISHILEQLVAETESLTL